jgi:hypothetical protein
MLEVVAPYRQGMGTRMTEHCRQANSEPQRQAQDSEAAEGSTDEGSRGVERVAVLNRGGIIVLTPRRQCREFVLAAEDMYWT